MYKITLADGTTLENLVLNGNNFIAAAVVDDAVFKDNMAAVTITDMESGSTEQIEDGVLLSNIVREGCSWIVLGQKTPEQKAMEARDKEIAELRQAMTVLLTGKEDRP